MSEQLTEWFPVSVKPVRAGVYQVKDSDRKSNRTWYSHFDGERWRGHWFTPKRALECPGVELNWSEETPWRGLAQPPKGEKR